MVCLPCFGIPLNNVPDIEIASEILQHPRSYVQEAAWHQSGIRPTDAGIWCWAYRIHESQPSSSRKFYRNVISPRLFIDIDMCPIQCLNLLRMGVYKDYYMQEAHEPAIFRDRPWKIKLHFGTSNPHLQLSQPVSSSYFNPSRMQLADHFLALEHCIEMLRQKIMCNADVGIIPHHCIKQSPDPFVNLNRWHKCRDIGSVERWIEEHAIPEVEGEGSLPRPEGDRVWGEPLWR